MGAIRPQRPYHQREEQFRVLDTGGHGGMMVVPPSGGQQLHDGRLDHGHERHVRVSGHGDAPRSWGAYCEVTLDGVGPSQPDDPDGDRLKLRNPRQGPMPA